jgi:DNA gyrase subunit B
MSIGGGEPTLVQDQRGQTRLVRLGELVDTWLEGREPAQRHSVISFDAATNETYFRPIKEVVRRKSTETLIHIRTRYNRSVKLTASHRILVYNDGEIQHRKAHEVRPGDLVVASRKLPRPTAGPQHIDLVETLYRAGQTESLYLKGEDVRQIASQRVLAKVSRPELWDQPKVALRAETWQQLIAHRQAAGLTQSQVAAVIGVRQPITISHWERGMNRPIRPHFEGYLKAISWNAPVEYELIPSKIEERLGQDDSSRNARWREVSAYKPFEEFTPEEMARLGADVQLVPQAHVHKAFARYIPVTQELMWFLGWYVAEGTLSAHQVSINLGLKDERFIQELIQTVERIFGETPRRYNDPDSNGIKLYFHSVAATRLLKAWGVAGRAHEKRLPDILFCLPEEFQLAFLEGYFLGDGTGDGGKIAITTNSPLLKDGLLYLFGQLSLIAGTVHYQPAMGPNAPIQTRHAFYIINLSGKEQLDSCCAIWYRHANAEQSHQHLANPGRKAMSFTPLGEALMGLEVLAVEEVEPEGAYVYDLWLDDGAGVICGSGGLAVAADTQVRTSALAE